MLRGLIVILSFLVFSTSCMVQSPQLMQGESVAVVNGPGNFSVVLSNDGWKKLGDKIEVTLLFPYSVTVTGTPYIQANFSSSGTRLLTYDSLGSSSQSLKFSYTVGPWDEDVDGIILDNFIQLAGGQLTYFLNGILTDCPLAISYPTYEIKVDGIAPTVTEIFKPISGNYLTGQKINYNLNFSEKVFVQPAAAFNLQIGTSSSSALYYSGSGTKVINFQKTIQTSELDSDGITNSSSFVNNTLIKDIAGNSVINVIPTNSSTLKHFIPESEPVPLPITSPYYSYLYPSIYVNLAVPTITSVTVSPTTASLINGQQLNIFVNFNSQVKVNTSAGIPAIKLNLSSGPKFAYYFSGTGTTQLVFRHTVGVNELASPLSMDSQIQLFGGTIKNLAETQNASLNFTPPNVSGISIGSMQNSYVTEIIYPADGTYKAGDILYFTLVFNRSINVTTTGGTPSIKIVLNSGTINPAYDSGSGSNVIRFKYTVTSSNYEPEGILIDPLISLNGGSMVDYLGANIFTTMATGLNAGVKIDAIAPQYSSLTAPAVGTYGKGEAVDIKVNFNKNVYVIGSPTLALTLNTSSTTGTATYLYGSGSNQLIFRYIVNTGDLDNTGITVNSLNLPVGSSIKDIFGSNSTTSFSASTFTGVKVDAVAPGLNVVTTSSTGTYGLGGSISFGVSFNDAVEVVGTPRLKLTVGTQTQYAIYTGATSPTQIIFTYIVGANQLDTDGISMDPVMDFNGGFIQDSKGNKIAEPFNLTSLPPLTSILVDSSGPVVASYTATGCPATLTSLAENNRNISLNFVFNEVVLVTGNPQVQILSGSKIYLANYVSTTTTAGPNPYSTVRFSHIVQDDELDLDGIAVISPFNFNNGTIRDSNSNLAELSFGGSTLIYCKVDGILPQVEALYPPANDHYAIGEELIFRVVWSENVTIDPLSPPDIKFTLGSVNKSATHLSTVESSNPFVDPVTGGYTGRVSIFKYTIQNGDLDTDGISIASLVAVNSGVTDAAGNIAVGTFPLNSVLNLSGVLVDGIIGTFSTLSVDASNNAFYPYYPASSVIRLKITTSEPAYVQGFPKIQFHILTPLVSYIRYATYEYGSGTNELYFTYQVQPGEDSTDLTLGSMVLTVNQKIRDFAGNDFNLTFPSLNALDPIIIDTIAPTITSSATVVNDTDPSKSYSFFTGQNMVFTLNYSEDVLVTGSPNIKIKIGSQDKTISYSTSLSTSSQAKFSYVVENLASILDLDGIEVTPSIQLNSGSIKDYAGNTAQLNFVFNQKCYVYYSQFSHRYNIATDSPVGNTFSIDGSNRVTSLVNLTEKEGNLEPYPQFSSPPPGQIQPPYGPVVSTTGFGQNNKGKMTFSNSALAISNLLTTQNVQAMILVIKPSTFTGMNRTIFHDQEIYLNSFDRVKIEHDSAGTLNLTNQQTSLAVNSGDFSTGSSFASIFQPSTNYILLLNQLNSGVPWYSTLVVDNEACIGCTYTYNSFNNTYHWSSSFSGEIAEIIFLDAPVSTAGLQTIRNQLNAIYGIY